MAEEEKKRGFLDYINVAGSFASIAALFVGFGITKKLHHAFKGRLAAGVFNGRKRRN